MADVRSMLRAERQKSRITHPYASYTSQGRLQCSVCNIAIKSEAVWERHLRNPEHALLLRRAQEIAASKANGTSKKRKALDLESTAPEERKRTKPTTHASLPETSNDAAQEEHATDKDLPKHQAKTIPSDLGQDGDEDDAAQLAAFDQQLADMETSMRADQTSRAAPTITAAPLTAAELAARAREEQSAQRGKREAELEAEKEDAARVLEDEFEEMETLQDRVRKLKDRRAALRGDGVPGTVDEAVVEGTNDETSAAGFDQQPSIDTGQLGEAFNDDDDEYEDEEIDDGWAASVQDSSFK